jgi:protein gp37
MGKNTKLSWYHDTFNPWIGCTKVSPGCVNCYAERDQDKRFHRVVWGRGKPRHRTSVGYWRGPLDWDREAQRANERRRIFCASLADVFDEEVPQSWRRDFFELISQTHWLDWTESVH